MSTELIILLVLLLAIIPKILYEPIRAFQEAGPHLGGRIEKQLDTGVGFQEMAFEKSKTQPLRWTDGE